MEFSLDRRGSLEAVLQIRLNRTEIQPKVDEVLRNYRKTAALPGFRKGMVPETLIRKQYGKSILIDEVNRMLNEGLNSYLNEQDIRFLGNPLPVPQNDIDWDSEQLSFDFELGLSPEFSLEVERIEIEKPVAAVAEAEIDEELNRLRRRFGRQLEAESIGMEDFVVGELSSNEVEHTHRVAFRMQRPELTLLADRLVGLAEGDTISISLANDFSSSEAASRLFEIDAAHLAEHGDVQNLTITKIVRVEPAELDTEFFSKVHPDAIDVDSLKSLIRAGLENENEQRSKQIVLGAVREAVVERHGFELPDAFLTKWLATQTERPLSETELAEQYELMKPGLRWQLIEGLAAREYGLRVATEDLRDEGFQKLMNQFGDSARSIEPSLLSGAVDRMLQDENEVRQLHDGAMSRKVLEAMAEKVQLKTKSVSSEELLSHFYRS